MTVKVKASIKRSQLVSADADALFALLDPAGAARFFPRVERIEHLGDGRYHWTLQPMGTQKYQHRVEYASQWECNAAQRMIRWKALPDAGNARISGAWAIEPARGGSRVSLEIRAELLLDLPRWMQLVAEPIVQTEFQKLLNAYFDNLVTFCQSGSQKAS